MAEETGKLHRRLKEIQSKGFSYSENDLIIRDRLEYAESIIDSVPEPLVVLDGQLKVVSANKSFYGTFKLKPEETVRKFIYDLGERQWDNPDLHKHLNEVLQQNKVIRNFQVKHNFIKIGKRIMVHRAELLHGRHGCPKLVFLSIVDITEQLREAQLKVRSVFDQTYQFIGLMTTDGILIEVNRAALDFSGIKLAEVLNRPFWETPWWSHSEELREKLRDSIKKVALGEFVRFEATHVAKDNSIHFIDFSLKPVKDESGEVIFMIPEGRDITERKKLEEALQQSYMELGLRVKVRTAELSRANEDLHNEVERRRKIEEELRSRMRDLERFSSLAVDRGLKIEELEEKIKEFESRLKKKTN